MPPHSKTVRGTLSNPKTKSAIDSGGNPPQLGDHVSLESEKDGSVPLSSVPDFSKPQQPVDPYRQNEELPHSQKVRGTNAHASGPTVNKSMLGDPISSKAETSQNEGDRGAGATGNEKMKEAAVKRGEYQNKKGASKL